MNKKWTGERLETNIYNRIAIEHLHRYAIARDYIRDKIVLDIASGEGYGSNLLSHEASFVYGVDIDLETITKAKRKYNKKNVNFLVGSTSNIPLKDESVDVVVSFETLEHHDEHHQMIKEIKRVLRPNGILIISTPDKKYYSDKRSYVNEFHVKELYKNQFLDLISEYFPKVQLLSQINVKNNSFIKDAEDHSETNYFSGDFSNIIKNNSDPMFLVIIASNTYFNKQINSVFDGSKLLQKEVINDLKTSTTFKMGHFILFPFKILKKLIKHR